MVRFERTHLAGLLLLLFLISAVTLGLAGWAADKILDGELDGANEVTGFVIFTSLIAGLATVAAVFGGIFHFRAWRVASLSGAASLALLAWLLSLLGLGFAAKHIDVDSDSKELQTLTAFNIILAFFNTVYVVGIHGGIYDDGYGLGY